MDNKYNYPMSVFCWSFTRRYALRHPVRILRWYFDARRQRKQRGRYGWCDNDVMDWYNWTAYVLGGLLRQISENKEMPQSRAAQIMDIANRITAASLGDVDESVDCRKFMAEAFAELGRIYFDFFC